MKTQKFNLVRYDADEGKVFDWAEARYHDVPDDIKHKEKGSHKEQEHLYVTTLFIGGNDSIDNYIEVDEPNEA